jgi:hypothetical protein
VRSPLLAPRRNELDLRNRSCKGLTLILSRRTGGPYLARELESPDDHGCLSKDNETFESRTVERDRSAGYSVQCTRSVDET